MLSRAPSSRSLLTPRALPGLPSDSWMPILVKTEGPECLTLLRLCQIRVKSSTGAYAGVRHTRDCRNSIRKRTHRYSVFLYESETRGLGRIPVNSAEPGFHQPLAHPPPHSYLPPLPCSAAFPLCRLHCQCSNCELFQGRTSCRAEAKQQQLHVKFPFTCTTQKWDAQHGLFMLCQGVPALELTAAQAKQSPGEHRK